MERYPPLNYAPVPIIVTSCIKSSNKTQLTHYLWTLFMTLGALAQLEGC